MGFQGILGSVGLGQESTYGTAVADQTAVHIVSCDLAEMPRFENAPDLHAGSAGAPRRRVETRRESSGSLVVLPSYVGLGILLQAAIGSNATTGAGPYTHTISSRAPEALPSFSARVRMGNSSYIKLFSGCKVGKLSVEWTGGQMGKMTVTVIAKQMDTFASGSPTSTTPLADVLPRHCGAVAWNSVSYSDVPSLRLDIDNKLEALFSVGSLYTVEPMPSGDGRKMIRVTASMRLTAAQYDTLEANMTGATTGNLTFTFTGTGNNAWALTVHNAQIVELRGNVQGAGTQQVSVVWEATDDGTGYDGVQLVQTNDNANFYA